MLRLRATCLLAATTMLASLPAVAGGAETAAPRGRLPDDAVPQAYRLDLTVDPARERFSGHVEIEVEVRTAAAFLWLNGKSLHINGIVVRAGGRTIPATYRQIDAFGLARLDFAQPLPAGKATLVFDYDAPFGTGAAGLYHEQVDGKWYAWSQFESIDARGVYPGFDQPGYKTPFAVTVTTPSGNLAVSNAPEERTEAAAPGMTRHVFAATSPLPTYLTAVMVGPFVAATGQLPPSAQRAASLPIRILATQPNRARLTSALDNTKTIVEHLEQYFGGAFPFAKLDQIAWPDMPGAMENAGAVTYADEVLLLGDQPALGQLQEFGNTVSHELAHQWFGDLVTPDWWSDVWLNESFADWLGYRIGNAWRPDLKLGTAAIAQAFAAMDLDALSAGRAIHQPIATNGDIASAFDPITYGKGGQVLAMIAAYMGDDGFRDGVSLHVARHAYGTATSDQFFRSLADSAHDPRIEASLRSFVDQQGVPLMQVERHGDTMTVRQSPYALLDATPVPRSWIIPFCYSIASRRSCVLLDKPSMTIPVKGVGPIMPNAGGTGYYRFALDDGSWQALIASVGALPPGEALATTDSLWAAFETGAAPARLLITEAHAVLANSYAAAAADPGNRFRTLVKHGVIDAAQLPAYRRMIHALYASRLAYLGFDPRAAAYAAEDIDRQKLRLQLVRLIALDAADSGVSQTLVRAADGWLAGDKAALDRSYSPNAFAAYVAVGGLPAAQRIFDRALTGGDGYFRAVTMDVIARSGDPAIARWFLAQFDDARLRPGERTRSVQLMMADAATRDLAYLALLARFDALAKGSFGGVAGLMSAPANFCSDEAAAMIERDLRPLADRHQAGALSLNRTIEKVRACGALTRAKRGDLKKAMQAAARA